MFAGAKRHFFEHTLMKNNVFVLPFIVGLSVKSCIKNDLQPNGSYLDDRFFISKPYMFAVDANRGESRGFKCTDDGFVIIRFWLGNFFQEDGWKLQMSAIFYGDEGSKSFFCEVDDIGSEYYKAEYTDEYYGFFEYSYDGPLIRGFEGQIPFSFFSRHIPFCLSYNDNHEL